MGAPSAAPQTGAEEVDQVITKRPTHMPFGDSLLIGSPLPRRDHRAAVKQETDPRQVLKGYQLARFLCIGLGVLSLFTFGIMALQPLLLPIFTMGACFANGAQEWIEFSATILRVSLIPGFAGLALSGVGYWLHRQVIVLADKLRAAEQDPRSPQALMARI